MQAHCWVLVLLLAAYARSEVLSYCKVNGTSATCDTTGGCQAYDLLYAGPCGCPNDCSSRLGHGACTTSAPFTCTCKPGWRGADCSLVDCSSNTCNGHGTCQPRVGGDTCVCAAGWTGIDCSVEIGHPAQLPFGEAFPGTYYSSKDEYGDYHPVFNMSRIATIKVDINQDDWIGMVKRRDNTWVRCNFTFDNGVIQDHLPDSAVRIKGRATRSMAKKGLNFKFGEFVEKRRWFGMKRLFIKGSWPDHSVISNIAITDFYRAAMVPVHRMSLAALWINDRYMGHYALGENLDDRFLKSRFAENEPNFYKAQMSGLYLRYTGEAKEGYSGYEKVSDDGNWTDFINLCRFLDKSDDQTFLTNLPNVLDVPMFTRDLVVQNFLTANDCGYLAGQNYYINHRSSDNMWNFVPFDFDIGYHARDPNNIFQALRSNRPYVAMRWFVTNPKNNATLIQTYKTLLTHIFAKPNVPTERYLALSKAITPLVRADLVWQISNSVSSLEAWEQAEKERANHLLEAFQYQMAFLG